MATKKTAAPSSRAVIHINTIPGDKIQDDVVISVNGERYQIQRGVDVAVPLIVAAAFEQWQKECKEAEKVNFTLSK